MHSPTVIQHISVTGVRIDLKSKTFQWLGNNDTIATLPLIFTLEGLSVCVLVRLPRVRIIPKGIA